VYLLKPEHFQAFQNKEDTQWGYIAEGQEKILNRV